MLGHRLSSRGGVCTFLIVPEGVAVGALGVWVDGELVVKATRCLEDGEIEMPKN